MMLKARLKLILMAEDVVVAESEDPGIWQAALQAIQGQELGGPLAAQEEISADEWVSEEERTAIRGLAKDLGVSVQDVLSACHPRTIAPYVFPNRHHWEAFKRQTPERGRNAVSNAVLAVTLLLLWTEKIHVDRVSLREGMAVLRTIGARDEHASRAVENCAWIQRSMGRLILNPDRISRAIAVGRAFCLKEPPQWDDLEDRAAEAPTGDAS